MPEKVQCAECGFLALRNLSTGDWVEADEEYRRQGAPTVLEIASHIPICFARAWPLQNELADQVKAASDADIPRMASYMFNVPKAERIREIIRKRRECSEWTRWQQGFTAKEHREMLDRKWMLDREDRRDREFRWWRVVEVVIFILAGVGTAIVAALIGRGTIFGP